MPSFTLTINVLAPQAVSTFSKITESARKMADQFKRLSEVGRVANQFTSLGANMLSVANSASTAALAAQRHTQAMRQQSAAARTLTADLRRLHTVQSQVSLGAVRTGTRGQTITHRESAARSVIDARAAGAIEREQARTAAAVARSQAQIRRSMQDTATTKDALGKNFTQFGMQVNRAMTQAGLAIRRTFTGEGGGILNLTSRLFSSGGMMTRGFESLGRAFKILVEGMSLNPFRLMATGLRAAGEAGLGLTQILGGAVSQVFRFAALPARLIGAFGSLIPKVGPIFSALGNLVGGTVAFIGDSIGEILHVGGRVFRGLTGIAAVALKPLASAFDFLISPIMRVFDVIKFAWQNSLVIMSAGAAAFTKSAASTFLAFERNVSEALSQIPRVGQEAFGQMQDVAMQLSRELGKGPTEIVNAIKLATSVGFSAVNDYTEIARQATRFATAGFADIETSVKALTNLLNSYGLGADQAARVNDLLFRGFQVGGGSAQFFAQGLGTIASSVHAAGGSMEDLIGTTALLSRAAAGNSRIFIEVQQAFQRIVSPTTKAAEAMQQMGIAIARNATGGVDFFSTLENIQRQIKALSGGDQLRAFQLLRNIFPEERAARAFAKLMSANADSIREVRQAMSGAGGSIADALTQVNARAGRQIEQMRAAWERLKISFGGAIAPAIAAGANALGNVFDTLQRKIETMSRTGGFDRLARSAQALMQQLSIPVTAQGIADFFERMVRTNIPNVIDKITDAAKRMRETLGGFTIKGAFDWLDNLRERGVTTFVSFGKAAIEAMRPVLGVVNTVAEAVRGLGEIMLGVGQIGASAFNVISAAVRGLGSLAVDLVAKFYDVTAAMHRVAAASPFNDAATKRQQTELGLADTAKAKEWRSAARALRERAGADIGQATAQSAAGKANIAQGAGRLADVFSGRTQAPAWLDQFADKLDNISKDFGKPFLDKARQLVTPGVPYAGPAPVPPKPIDPFSRDRGTGVVVPVFQLDPLGQRRAAMATAHSAEMQRRRDAFARQYPGLAGRTRPAIPSAGVVPQPPELPGAPASMKGGRALMELLGPTVREPAPAVPEGPSVRGGGSLLQLPARQPSGRESAVLDAARENIGRTASAASTTADVMREVAELLEASTQNIARLQAAVERLSRRNEEIDSLGAV